LTPRLVATDLDGTLLHTDGTVTPYTRDVLDELDRRGVHVVFVTGRPVRWMDALWEAVGGHGLAVCSNGGVVYDVAAHGIRNALTIDPDVAVRVGRVLRSGLPGTAFAVEKTGGFGVERTFLAGGDVLDGIPVGPLEEIVDGTVVKLLAQHAELAPEPFWHRVEELVGSLVATTWSSTFAMVEMSAHGVTKASTLGRLCGEFGIGADEVVAFGDMPNDLPMLTWAGTSYAMANAHPSVQQAADHVAPSNDSDGVAATLVEIFGLESPGDASGPLA
jgi:hydroxymethylpyrimidine pyrophosphatase-like HAD family hydrolase